MKQENQRQRVSTPSKLLTPDENDTVFSLLGPRCISMSTAVIQLFTTEPPAHSLWVKRSSGVACFVKDFAKKSYFIRVYDVVNHVLIWEEEMYETISFDKPINNEYLITFEGEQCMVGLSFAAVQEADHFYKFASKMQTVKPRRNVLKSAGAPLKPAAPSKSAVAQQNSVAEKTNLQKQQNASAGSNKTGIRKITKEDISGPSNFQHLFHQGWDAKSLNGLFEEAGVSKKQLDDENTRKIIVDIVGNYNPEHSDGSAAGQRPMVRPKRQRPPPPKPSPGSQKKMNCAAPPPPPPPPMLSGPPMENLNSAFGSPNNSKGPMKPVPDARDELMESIRGGLKLKKVSTTIDTDGPINPGLDARDELMASIRGGLELKKIPNTTDSRGRNARRESIHTLADVLRKALSERVKAMESSDDEDNEETEEWDE